MDDIKKFDVISAQTAAALTNQNKETQENIINESIESAARRGKSSALIFTSALDGLIKEELKEKLIEAGYTIQLIIDYYVISWKTDENTVNVDSFIIRNE